MTIIQITLIEPRRNSEPRAKTANAGERSDALQVPVGARVRPHDLSTYSYQY